MLMIPDRYDKFYKVGDTFKYEGFYYKVVGMNSVPSRESGGYVWEYEVIKI